MKVSEFFPYRFLRADDLKPGVNTVLIEDFGMEEVRSQNPKDRGKTNEVPVLWLKGFPKAFRLNKTNTKIIVRILGSDNTRDWIGKTIGIYGDSVRIDGEDQPCICVDNKRQATPKVTCIGTAGKQRFLDALKARGTGFQQFIEWLKRTDRAAHDLTLGIELEQIPSTLIPFMQQFLNSASQASPANSKTPAPKPDPQRNHLGDPVGQMPDDDIPF